MITAAIIAFIYFVRKQLKKMNERKLATVMPENTNIKTDNSNKLMW